ncbi:MAG: hypothetical protein PHN21_05955 [Erysipelotrichaceae bacterium]|nr:hypothetical protein [Erysipelotrichaceae bacterium]
MINILWLYDDLLDLYGDSGNLMIIKYYLKQNGIEYKIDKLSISDKLDLSKYDMIYIGPGKIKNLIVASQHFNQYKQQFSEAIEQGKLILISGNAQLLLSRSITTSDNINHLGSGLLEFDAIDNDQVFISDVIAQTNTDPSILIYGFINRTSYILPYSFNRPLLTINKGLSDHLTSYEQGFLINNLFASWLLGPILVKNPQLLRKFLCILTKKDNLMIDDQLSQTAYKLTVDEFK